MGNLKKRIEQALDQSSVDEFLSFMFDGNAEKERRFIDSLLDQYDARRGKVLIELAEHVPEEHKDFFIHAFSRRTSEDDL
jgi:hypothetical protein